MQYPISAYTSHFPAVNQQMSSGLAGTGTMINSGIKGAGTGAVGSTSTGVGFGTVAPDLSKANSFDINQFTTGLSKLTYSAPGGGYLFSKDAGNANSFYNKFGGSDPGANSLASQLYGWLGSLPTRTYGTAALEKFYNSGMSTPASGPSFNERLGKPWQGPFSIG